MLLVGQGQDVASRSGGRASLRSPAPKASARTSLQPPFRQVQRPPLLPRSALPQAGRDHGLVPRNQS